MAISLGVRGKSVMAKMKDSGEKGCLKWVSVWKIGEKRQKGGSSSMVYYRKDTTVKRFLHYSFNRLLLSVFLYILLKLSTHFS